MTVTIRIGELSHVSHKTAEAIEEEGGQDRREIDGHFVPINYPFFLPPTQQQVHYYYSDQPLALVCSFLYLAVDRWMARISPCIYRMATAGVDSKTATGGDMWKLITGHRLRWSHSFLLYATLGRSYVDDPFVLLHNNHCPKDRLPLATGY